MVSLREILLTHLNIPSGFKRRLEEKKIYSLSDLLYYFPIKYEDRTKSFSIKEGYEFYSKDGERSEESNIFLTLFCLARGSFLFNGRSIQTFIFTDGENEIELVAFNPSHQFFKKGEQYYLAGKIVKINKTIHNQASFKLKLVEWQHVDDEDDLAFNRITPIYSLTEGISQKRIRRLIYDVLDGLNNKTLKYNIPQDLVSRYRLSPKLLNIRSLHFPKTIYQIESTRNELVYEEFYCLQEQMCKKKILEKEGKKRGQYLKTYLWEEIQNHLPFELTKGQKDCLLELREDLNSPAVMRRLVQGEVGSGKTILALCTMVLAYDNGYQSTLLVPTDVLARQHYKLFIDFVCPFLSTSSDLGNEIGLLVGSNLEIQNRDLKEKIRRNEIKLIIGTHSLFQSDVQYFNLKLVVIDEQHRFGVDQRKSMIAKGEKVDCLMMSATPIPRSLSMSVFGYLDISILKDVPKTQLVRKSKCLPERDRVHAYTFLKQRVLNGEQGYIVFPLIESMKESKKSRGKLSLIKEYEHIKKKVFKGINVNFIHGRMSDQEKQEVMMSFVRGDIKVLFSTTVLEVGLDVKNATVIIIESAEQFGLSQLHQLRGRVGRGEKQGYCYLIYSQNIADKTRLRLNKFIDINDGFKISELDLEIRGTGDFLGKRQSGLPKFRIGDIIKDYAILDRAREDAQDKLVKRLSAK